MYQSAMLYSCVGKFCTTRKCISLELIVNCLQCHVDEEQQCKKASCVSAVGNFFFGNNGEFRFTRQVFECCEHSDNCFGYPGHVYSPWNCLEKGLSDCGAVFYIRFRSVLLVQQSSRRMPKRQSIPEQ